MTLQNFEGCFPFFFSQLCNVEQQEIAIVSSIMGFCGFVENNLQSIYNFYSIFIIIIFYFLNSKEKFLTLFQLAKIVNIYLANYQSHDLNYACAI